jgi:uncharacterized protein YprB with RNaseH-like and TPR domain
MKLQPALLPWYHGLTIGFWDIETGNLEANGGGLLSRAIKVRGESEVLRDLVTPKELRGNSGDKRICKSLLKAVNSCDILCGHYSKRFDAPFARIRALANNLDFPVPRRIDHGRRRSC